MLAKKRTAVLQQKIDEQSETISNLRRVIAELNETIDSLRLAVSESNQANAELNQTIKDLTEKLGMNSGNSSKPPSSDGFNKPSPKSLRKPSGNKAGGQQGHPGVRLESTVEPDEIVRHMPSPCSGCPLSEICEKRACVGETRQVIDAVVTVKVTEHQSLVVEECPLHGVQQKGEFPDEVKANVQYGEQLQALTVALNTIGAVSVNRTHEILSSIFGIPLSTGTVVNMVSNCAEGLTETLEQLRERMASSTLGHFDETGTNVDGKNMWVHVASNAEYTHLSIHEKRGFEGMEAGGVLPNFTKVAVHDCWASYWKYSNILHGLCCAHLLRELVGVEENHPEQKWAPEFKKLLLEMKKARDNAVANGEEQLSSDKLKEFEQLYDEIIELAYEENPLPESNEKKRGRKKKGKVLSLIERLDLYEASVCLFVHNFAVPFDNNQAERDCRMIKTKKKVSGCFRSKKGANDYLKIMSYVGTAKKHGLSPFEAIRQAILGSPEYIFAK